MKWKLEKRKVNNLKEWSKNPRSLTKKGLSDLKKSINKFGIAEPLVVNLDNTICGGHGRKKILEELKIVDVDCYMPERLLTEKEFEELNIRLNKNIAGEWDFDILANEFEIEDLKEWGFEDFELGLEAEEDEIIEDEVPETQEDPIVKRGDVWILGNHRLGCGNSTNIDDVKKLMDNNKIDMIFTDPPYGINEKGDRSKRIGIQKANNFHDFIDDSTQYAIDAFNLCSAMNIPVQVWWGANYYADSLPPSPNWLIWDKRVEEKQRDTQSDCEIAWAKSRFQSIRIFRHLWKGLIKGSENGIARIHPTQKPIALASWAFKELEGGNNILDLFGGSGATLIACEQTNRKCFMMELDERYSDVIIRRWQNLTGKDAVLESNNKTFNELEINNGK